VIVVDKDDNVRPLGLLPLPGPVKALEYWVEIIVTSLPLVNRNAEQGNMATAYACGNACHINSLP